jgi:membrane-bound lytic murein transglycosylase B
MYALHMLNQHQVSLDQFKGEWAGATGQPQFLPSSWFQYAVDYDDCGRKDIWTSYPDVFASIANYLVKNNWRNDEPVMVEVELPDDFDLGLIGKTITKPVKEWNELGVSTSRGGKLPFPELSASVIQPDGGETFLIYPNFKVLLTYNNSIYYAGTVDYLAHAICSNAP